MSQIFGQSMGSPMAIVDTDGRVHTNNILDGVKIAGSGVVTFKKEHDRIIQGKTHYVGSVFYEIPKDGSASIFLDVGSLNIHTTFNANSDGDMELVFMEDVSVTDSGVAIDLINKNRTSANTMNTQIFSNPTLVGSGNVIHTSLFLGGSGVATKFVSADINVGIEGSDWILSSGLCYWLKFTNRAGRLVSVDWDMEMHSH